MTRRESDSNAGADHPAPKRRARASRAETTRAILDAAEELFAVRHPSDVTVRDVAERAGVTHALVHTYVGTKEDLLNAVLQRAAVNRTALVRESPSLGEALETVLQQILTNRVHSKALVRSAMDGVEYVSLKDRIETGHALVDLAERTVASGAKPSSPPQGIDPRVVVAAVSSLAFGWAATEDWAWPAFDLDPAQKDEVYRQLGQIVRYLADLVLVRGDNKAAIGE